MEPEAVFVKYVVLFNGLISEITYHVVEVIEAVFLNIKLGRLCSLLVSLMVVAACR